MFDRKKIARNDGHIEITKQFARSILRRMGFVKGIKAVETLPSDFENIESEFVKKVKDLVSEFSVLDSLMINKDQTGYQVVPGCQWTMEERGSKQVTVAVLLEITKSEILTLTPPPRNSFMQGKPSVVFFRW